MMDQRIVCVWIPRFRLEVEARERPEPEGRPVVIYQPSGRWRELVECPPQLSAEGMWTGMPLKEAESRWPGAIYRPDEPERYARALEPVLHALDAFSPAVEAAPPELGSGVAFLDGVGLEPLYGPEEQLGRRIVREIAQTTGYLPRVGIADGKFAARLVAAVPSPESLVQSQEVSLAELGTEDSGLVRVVPPGEDAAFLAPLPLDFLPLPTDARERAARLGLRTLGEFAHLPANSLRHRFGPEGVRARALAAGQDDEPLRPRPTPLVVRDELDFEWIETDLDRVTFALKRLADRLSARLLRHGLGCGRLAVTWRLDDDSAREATVHLAERSVSGGRLLEHLRWHVEGLRLEHGVSSIAIEAEELAPIAGQQLKLLPGEDGRLPREDRLLKARDVLARLRARWGQEAVRQAELVASRRPEASFRWRDNLTLTPSLSHLGEGGGEEVTSPLSLAPEPHEVDLHSLRVTGAAGPWRLVEPWSAEPVARDSYHVVTSNGEACWLVYDHLDARWRIYGSFD